MRSNIEPGCLAIVVRHPMAENIGKAVTVGRYLGENIRDSKNNLWIGRRWEVNRAIRAYNLLPGGPDEFYAKHIAEECLMRIDDYQAPVLRQTAQTVPAVTL